MTPIAMRCHPSFSSGLPRKSGDTLCRTSNLSTAFIPLPRVQWVCTANFRLRTCCPPFGNARLGAFVRIRAVQKEKNFCGRRLRPLAVQRSKLLRIPHFKFRKNPAWIEVSIELLRVPATNRDAIRCTSKTKKYAFRPFICAAGSIVFTEYRTRNEDYYRL